MNVGGVIRESSQGSRVRLASECSRTPHTFQRHAEQIKAEASKRDVGSSPPDSDRSGQHCLIGLGQIERFEGVELVSWYQDFRLETPLQLEESAEHVDEKEGNCNYSTI
jgi:hypothetical protein